MGFRGIFSGSFGFVRHDTGILGGKGSKDGLFLFISGEMGDLLKALAIPNQWGLVYFSSSGGVFGGLPILMHTHMKLVFVSVHLSSRPVLRCILLRGIYFARYLDGLEPKAPQCSVMAVGSSFSVFPPVGGLYSIYIYWVCPIFTKNHIQLFLNKACNLKYRPPLLLVMG